MNSDEEFAANIAHTVELVARGDVEAFVIPGQTALEEQGARRFAMAYSALAAAAKERSRTVVLRWQFDEPESHYAKLNTVSNAEKLLAALRPFAVAGTLPPAVRVEFENLGKVPTPLHESLEELGIFIL